MVAIITTDHAASNYGIPVLLEDGTLVGPQEIADRINATDPDISATWMEVQEDINRQYRHIADGNPLMEFLTGAPTRCEILAARMRAAGK